MSHGLGRDGWPSNETVIKNRDAEIESLRQQLAAANAELVRKQERDSQYSNVCCKLSATENEVVLLRQQLAEKDAEIERLYKSIDDNWISHQKLAANQAREQQLRDGIEAELSDEWRCESYHPKLFAAIAQPADTTALSAMIAKAGEVMRESVIEQCIAMGAMSRDGAFVEEIRALPGVTLEDLK